MITILLSVLPSEPSEALETAAETVEIFESQTVDLGVDLSERYNRQLESFRTLWAWLPEDVVNALIVLACFMLLLTLWRLIK